MRLVRRGLMPPAAPGPGSRAEFARAQRILAGGVDSPVRAGEPMGCAGPLIASASGSHVVDVDGRDYIDYLCAYGPVFLGHGHRGIAEAVARAAAGGAVYGTTHVAEIRLAERIAGHMPSLQRLRFTSTGTEACMSALRLARAHTRRSKVVRFAGNYHGHSDAMIFAAGASANTPAHHLSGVTRGVSRDVVVVPYNDIAALNAAFVQHPEDIAAVIIEPIAANMGLVLPLAGYLSELCALCRKFKALTIFDEVITGFRLGLGGAQGRLDVSADLTCIGKVLGGGLPIAAFGGRADVMNSLAPRGPVFAGGTFSGNPVCVAAANAFLDVLEGDPSIYARVEAIAQRLAQGMRKALADAALPYPVVTIGSIVDFMFRAGQAHRDAAEAAAADGAAYARFYWAMLAAGVLLAPSKMEVMFLTAAHSASDVDRTVNAMAQGLQYSR